MAEKECRDALLRPSIQCKVLIFTHKYHSLKSLLVFHVRRLLYLHALGCVTSDDRYYMCEPVWFGIVTSHLITGDGMM